MRSMKLRRLFVVAAAVLLGTVPMRAPAQEDLHEELSAGGLRQYQITGDNRHICWMTSCGLGFCCLVY
jgi:hypothetical protein